MKVKLFEKVATPFIGGVDCDFMKEREITNIEHLKHYINKGIDIRVKDGEEFVAGKDYFADDKEESKKEEVKTTTVTAEVENTINLEAMFDNHWKTQVKEVQALDSVELVKDAIEYAEANDVSDTVIKEAKNHLNELQE